MKKLDVPLPELPMIAVCWKDIAFHPRTPLFEAGLVDYFCVGFLVDQDGERVDVCYVYPADSGVEDDACVSIPKSVIQAVVPLKAGRAQGPEQYFGNP
jgi:hypothetical protein